MVGGFCEECTTADMEFCRFSIKCCVSINTGDPAKTEQRVCVLATFH